MADDVSLGFFIIEQGAIGPQSSSNVIKELF